MLLSVAFTGCSSKTDDEAVEDVTDTASESTMTLTMYLMSEGEISDEQASKIEDAVNKITKSKFKTKLVLHYFTEAEYNTALENAFKATEDAKAAKKAAEQALKDAIKRGEATAAATTTAGETEEETIVNEYGVTELKYPSVEDYQVDIFYLGGYDKFMEYLGNEWLSRLDEELTSSSKLLNDYVAPEYLTYMKQIGGGTYAIPNNTVVGEYTYLLLNKEVLAKYDYSNTKSFTSLTCDDVKDLLANVAKYNKNEYLPLYSATGELDVSNVNYYGLDENGKLSREFSVIGGTYDTSYSYKGKNQFYSFNSVFSDSGFQKQIQTLVQYKENGYYGDETNANLPFAVGYVKGGAQLAEQYGEDYEMVVVESPKISTEDIFANMFAVGSYTSSVSRSMKIITYLNTNVDFRNLILYGIEGENYELVDTKVENAKGETYKAVRMLEGNTYLMNAEKTGNTLITYPMEGELPNIRDYQMKQNRDMTVMLDMGFAVNYDDNVINSTSMAKVRELSADLYDKLMACSTMAELEEFLNGKEAVEEEPAVVGVKALCLTDDNISLMRNAQYSTDHDEYGEKSRVFGEGVSFAYIYMTWLTDMGIYVEEA